MAAGAVKASDGTITITGEITTNTCKINGGDPPANMLVNLPKISTSALKNEGDVAGATPFIIRLTECPSSINDNEMKVHFEAGKTTDYGTGNLIAYTSTSRETEAKTAVPSDPGTTKEHVQIQLSNLNGTAIKLGDTDQKVAGFKLKEHNGHRDGELRYLAQYIKTGTNNTLSAGVVVTYVSFSLVYP